MLDGLGILLTSLLALQVGIQPYAMQALIPRHAIVTVSVLVVELFKLGLCACFIIAKRSSLGLSTDLQEWTFWDSVKVAGLPAAVYAFQNICIQLAYQNLDGLSFNVLNQTKLVFTAFFAFLFVGRIPTRRQVLALVLVSVAGVIISISESRTTQPGQRDYVLGLTCISAASVFSGFASGLSERALSGKHKRDTYLFSAELAVFSMATLLFQLCTFDARGDLARIRAEGAFIGWSFLSLVPLLSQGAGGVLVGLLTKHCGGVSKTFGITAGILLTALSRPLLSPDTTLSPPLLVAVPLVLGSVWLYSTKGRLSTPLVSSVLPTKTVVQMETKND